MGHHHDEGAEFEDNDVNCRGNCNNYQGGNEGGRHDKHSTTVSPHIDVAQLQQLAQQYNVKAVLLIWFIFIV